MRSQGNGEDLPRQRGILLFGNQRKATKRSCWPIHADLYGLQEQGCLRQHAEPELSGELGRLFSLVSEFLLEPKPRLHPVPTRELLRRVCLPPVLR